MIDPLLSLAFALNNTKGAYVLLLGSGVSRAAGIPTGWEIVMDLTRRLAAAEGQDAGADPATWYRGRFGGEPDYSKLLEALAGTAAERRDLLRGYFEPSADELTSDLKRPTKAHRAIARLARGGYVRVIVTTNFDPLIETALRDEGITPAVISSPDAIRGAMPLQHETATVIKLHGDYLDTRIKNTPGELEAYDPLFDQLLDRVLDEYGLVVCGWSGAWDEALRAAITRCPTRRFTTFWAAKGPLGEEAERLARHRAATVIPIESADAFFESIADRVESLEELNRPHPASAAVALAALKRYVSTAEHRIRLHDLVMAEVEAVRDRTVAQIPTAAPDNRLIPETITNLEPPTEVITTLLASGAYWGGAAHRQLWVKVLERLGSVDLAGPTNYVVWRQLVKYPAQLAFYAAGLGAVAAGDDETLADVLLTPKIRSATNGKQPPILALHQYAVVEDEWPKLLPGLKEHKAPMSDHLHDVLRPSLRDVVPDDESYSEVFDRFEYLVALAHAGMRFAAPDSPGVWGPIGRFSWRSAYGQDGGIIAKTKAELDKAGENWFLLRRGLFGGSLDRLCAIVTTIDELAQRRGSF